MLTFLIVSAAGRLLERLIDACGGILCLFLGYKLFAASAADVIKAQIVGKGFTFKAERIGPGVFFALFGAVVLVYSVTSPVRVSENTLESATSVARTDSSAGRPGISFAGAIDVGGSSANVAKDRLQALVTLEQVAKMDGEAASRLAAANTGLQAIRNALLEDIFGQQRVLEWEKLVAMRGFQDAEMQKQLAADPKLQQRFQEIEDASMRGF